MNKIEPMSELESQTIVRALALLSIATPAQPLIEKIAERFVAGRVLLARFREQFIRTSLPGLHAPSCDPDPLCVSIDYLRAAPSDGTGMVLPIAVAWNEQTSLALRWQDASDDKRVSLGPVARMLPLGVAKGLRRAKFLVDPLAIDLTRDGMQPELFLSLDEGDGTPTMSYRLGWLADARCDDYDGGYAIIGFVDRK